MRLGTIIALAMLTLTIAPPDARAVDITGSYTGVAYITGGIPATLSVTFQQNGTTVTGTLNVRFFQCLSGLSFSGTLSGTTLQGSFTGTSALTLSGTVNGTQVSGDFVVTSSPCASGSGTFTLTRTVPTPSGAPTSTALPSPTPPPVAAGACVGDCTNDGAVTVAELLSMVNIALGNAAITGCLAGDGNRDKQISINDILAAVNNALNGCGPPGPLVTSVTAAGASGIVPLSVIHIHGSNFATPDQLQHVTIGGVDAELAATIDANTLAVIIPAIAPGPVDVVVFNANVRGNPYAIVVTAPTPIGAPDTFDDTLALLDTATAELLGLDLETAFGDDAAAVRQALADFRTTLTTQRNAFAADITPAERAQLDAAIDSSGLPDLLRSLIDDLHGLASSGKPGANLRSDTGAAAADTALILAAASRWGAVAAIARGIVAAAATFLTPPGALAAAALALAAGVAAGLAVVAAMAHAPMATVLVPLLVGVQYFDIDGRIHSLPTAGGRMNVQVAHFDPATIRLRTVFSATSGPFDLAPFQVGEGVVTFQLPLDEDFCGQVAFSLFDSVTQRFSNQLPSRVLPEMLSVMPEEGKPKDPVTLLTRGVGICPGAFARFENDPSGSGRRGTVATVPLTDIGAQRLFQVHVPNLAPETYEVSVNVAGLSSTLARRPALPPFQFGILSAITGLKVTCSRTELALPPFGPSSTSCTAAPLPPGTAFPPPPPNDPNLGQVTWHSSNAETASVMPETTNYPDSTTSVTAQLPGTAMITASVNFAGSSFTSSPVSIAVEDKDAPKVELTTSSPSLVDPGESITVHVVARDNVAVSRVQLVATGEVAGVAPAAEVPCPLLENECAVDFTVQVATSGFKSTHISIVAEAFDSSGHQGSSLTRLQFTIRGDTGDTHCPQLTIQSPAGGSTVNAGSTVLVTAQATDNQPGDTGIRKFTYSATGAALVANVGPQDLPSVQPLPPQSTLHFNFQVKSAADLASVTDRMIRISVQAFDAAMPARDCAPQVISVTAAAPPTQCEGDPKPPSVIPPHCNDPTSGARIEVQPSQGFNGVPYTVTVTITGPEAAQVMNVTALVEDGSTTYSHVALRRQPDGSFRDTLASRYVSGTHPIAFVAYDAHFNPVCCGGGTNYTWLGQCTKHSDCGAGATCYQPFSDPNFCVYTECVYNDFPSQCPSGKECLFNGTCH